ncbi:MAG TPA: SIMPL domain-containing protein [Phenylobacterium sp.]|nr:SIMPL domain-containing protein [Phenylobacterium sp.]
MKTFLRAGMLALALGGGALSAASAEAQTQTQTVAGPPADSLFHATTLNLTAHGETKLAPDMATITLGVTTEASTAAKALSDNARRMTQMTAALKAAGVPAKDIRTAGLNLNPQYVYEQGQPPRLTGYNASDEVMVTAHDVAKVGALVDAAVGAGANQVNGVSFGLADPTAAGNMAREEAVRALAAKAELYAKATGYRVARLVSLSEGGGIDAFRPQPVAVQMMARAQAAPTVVAPGQLTVRVDISGLYELSR